MELPVFRFNIWLDTYEEYNCSATDIVWHSEGTNRSYFGAFCITFGLITIPLHIVCARTMLSMPNLSVWKIMIYLAIADIGSSAELFHIWNIAHQFFFFCSTVGVQLLAINRFGELLAIPSITWFFQGSRTSILLILCTIPFLLMILFTPPLLFNSTHHLMFFDPMIYNGQYVYNNYVHLACATLMPGSSFIIYVALLICLFLKFGNITKSSNAFSRCSFQIIIQSGFIRFIHVTTCSAFQLLQFVPINALDTMLFIVHIGWMLVHGTPPIIYLSLNPTIRERLIAANMAPTRQVIVADKAPPALGSYSHAVRVGDKLYLSGQIGTLPETNEFASGGIEEQAHQALRNIEAVLKAAGAGFENVAKTMVLLKSIEDLPKINKIYKEYFKDSYPARTAFQVANLPFKALVEIEAIALVCKIENMSKL